MASRELADQGELEGVLPTTFAGSTLSQSESGLSYEEAQKIIAEQAIPAPEQVVAAYKTQLIAPHHYVRFPVGRVLAHPLNEYGQIDLTQTRILDSRTDYEVLVDRENKRRGVKYYPDPKHPKKEKPRIGMTGNYILIRDGRKAPGKPGELLAFFMR